MSRAFVVPVTLPTDPVNALEAATKQYVDAKTRRSYLNVQSNATDQSISDSAYALVLLTGTKLFDSGDMTVASSVITVTDPGVYAISGFTTWGTAVGTGSRRMLLIESFTTEALGAGVMLARAEGAAATGVFVALNPYCEVSLVAGAKVRMLAYQNSGVALGLRNGLDFSRLNIHKIS